MKSTPNMDYNNRMIEETLLSKLYQAFNDRNIDVALAGMHPEVDWPNGMEGGIEHGRDAVRSYWTRQWSTINPHVEPLSFERMDDERIAINVHQVVKDLAGNMLIDEHVHHIYTMENGSILTMEIVR